MMGQIRRFPESGFTEPTNRGQALVKKCHGKVALFWCCDARKKGKKEKKGKERRERREERKRKRREKERERERRKRGKKKKR